MNGKRARRLPEVVVAPRTPIEKLEDEIIVRKGVEKHLTERIKCLELALVAEVERIDRRLARLEGYGKR